MKELNNYPLNKEQLDREYEQLHITNRFMFNKVMSDKKLCSKVLQCLTGKEISEIKSIVTENCIEITEDSRGVRYDVYVEDADDRVFDAEMQNFKNNGEMPLRSRYYQSMIDLVMMSSGQRFTKLKESYVIFICNFDPFGIGERCYEFSNRSGDTGEVALGDKRSIIIYNIAGKPNKLHPEANEFLDYAKDGTITGSLADILDGAVKDARHNKEWRAEYMMHMAYYWDVIDEGREIGIEEGEAKLLVEHVNRYMNNTGASLEDTLKLLGETMDDYLKAKEIVEQNA